MTDQELLSEMALKSSAEAYGEIVRRNINLVCSAARRQLGDSSLADDVTQAVFVLLGQKAKQIKRPLAGWLIKATYFACRDARKMAARREYHERRAAMMRNEQTPQNQEPQWEQYARALDEAIAKMNRSDRDAIALRYLRGMNLAEAAQALGISEKAAEKRVTRAAARLRQTLASQFAMPAAATIAMELAARGSEVTPAALADSIIRAGTTIGKGTIVGMIARKAGEAMYWTKVKIAATVLGGVILAGGAGTGTIIVLADGPGQSPSMQPAPAAAPIPARQMAGDVTVQSMPPAVIKTEPQAGVTDVDPGTTEIRVTFSKDMLDGDWSWSQISDQTFPKVTGRPHYLDDHRTCVLPVQLRPNQTYVFWLNSERFKNFRDTDGNSAVPYLLVFQTKPAP